MRLTLVVGSFLTALALLSASAAPAFASGQTSAQTARSSTTIAASPSANATASTSSSAHPTKPPKFGRVSPQVADAYVRALHEGSKPPAHNAVRTAFQQAAELPITGGVWQPLGPQPEQTSGCPSSYVSFICTDYHQVTGRVTAIAVNTLDPTGQDVWLGSADGGVWHSTDGGQQWTSVWDVVDDMPLLAIGAIALNPTNPQQIFVGTGEDNGNGDAVWGDGIYVSQNGGTTFAPATLTGGSLEYGNVAKIAVSNTTTQFAALAATSDGLFYASSPTSWSLVPDVVGQLTDVAFDPEHPNIAYAAVAGIVARDPNGSIVTSPLWRSANYGQAGTWTPVELGASSLPSGATIERASVGLSQDGQTLYVVLTNQYPNQEDGPPDALYGGVIWVSTDGGLNWTTDTVPSNMTDDSQDSLPIPNTPQWLYESAVAVDPYNPQNVYVGGVDLWHSSDGGASWYNVTNDYAIGPGANTYNVHPDTHALIFVYNGSYGLTPFYDGNDGGVWKDQPTCSGTDGCPQFTNLNGGGLNLTQFYGGSIGTVGTGNGLWGGAQDNGESAYPMGSGCVQQINCPAQWQMFAGGDGGDTAVDYTNNLIVYEESDRNINVSTDDGVTWTNGMTGINPNDQTNGNVPFVMSPTHPKTLVVGTDRVYETTNGASSWSPISPALAPPPNSCGTKTKPVNCAISAVAMAATSDDSVIYAGTNNGLFCSTLNSGTTWNCDYPQGSSEGDVLTSIAVDPTNPAVVYATFDGFSSDEHVAMSTDWGLGSSWTDIGHTGAPGGGGFPAAPAMSVLVNPLNSQQLFVGSDAGVYTTVDNGATWLRFGSNLPAVEVSQIFTDHAGSHLYLATHGRGMWSIPIEDQHVYQGTCNPYGATGSANSIYSIDAVSGVMAWSTTTTTMCPESPALANGVLYFRDGSVTNPNANGIYAFNASTGAPLWSHLISASVTTGPTAANGLVYVGTADNHLDALNPSTGALVWTSACLCKANQVLGVYFIAANGTLYVSDDDQYIYALDPNTGATLWTYAPSVKKGRLDMNLAYANGLLYFTTSTSTSTGWTGYISALNTTTQKVAWSYQPVDSYGKAVAPTDPAVANGTLYFGTTGNYAYAVNASTGALIFHMLMQSLFQDLQVLNNVVYIEVTDTSLTEMQAFDGTTGAQLWTYNPPLGVFGVGGVSGNLVYVNNSYNGVVALNSSTGVQVWNTPGHPIGEYASGLVVGP